MARRYTNGLRGDYFLSSQWLQDGIRQRDEQDRARRRAAAEAAQRESELQRAERVRAVIAAGRRILAGRYHPDRNPAGAARMVAVNRVADQLEAGRRTFTGDDLGIARELVAAGKLARSGGLGG